MKNYFVYIVTNKSKQVLYTGVTNDLKRRLNEHKESVENNSPNFTGRYQAFYLIYWERFFDIRQAIEREKEIKGWLRAKKKELISSQNPEWRILNDDLY